MELDVTQFHQVFFEESLEHLSNMESSLLKLGSSNDAELINIIFRGAHSIKGGSAIFGFKSVSEFTNLAETLLDQIRSGSKQLTEVITLALLESVDILREMIYALKSGGQPDENKSAQMKLRLQALINASAAVPEESISHSAPSPENTSKEDKINDWMIYFKPHRNIFQTGNDPYRIMRELSNLGEMSVIPDISALPELNLFDPEQCYLSWNIKLRSRAKKSEIDEIFAWVEGDCELTIAQAISLQHGEITQPQQSSKIKMALTQGQKKLTRNENDPRSGAERRESNDRRHTESDSIRVNIEKIDAIINLVGELVITQSMLSQVGADTKDLSGKCLENLRNGLAQLERNTRELQESVMRIRMLPISFAFSRFPRLVHDLSHKLGKKIELSMSGEQTELDKTVIEKIGDPLVHLVRNAADHGIEMPAERIKSGKSETGLIHLNAYHHGGKIIIEIDDDGAGLNRNRIIKKARESGLIAEGIELDDQKIFDLIFEPGLSTAESVSDVSGRGVGMDVVRRNIRDLGGTVEVTSTAGQGSRFTIHLPLTLAILDGQLVSVAGQVYIVPLVSIVESLQVRAERVNNVASRGDVYRLRDEYIPIMDLRRVFGKTTLLDELVGSLLVVVEAEGKKLGLVVNDLLGQQQVVIKSLEINYKPIHGISGATILGDGTVALILDAGQLVSSVCSNTAYKDGNSGKSTVAA